MLLHHDPKQVLFTFTNCKLESSTPHPNTRKITLQAKQNSFSKSSKTLSLSTTLINIQKSLSIYSIRSFQDSNNLNFGLPNFKPNHCCESYPLTTHILNKKIPNNKKKNEKKISISFRKSSETHQTMMQCGYQNFSWVRETQNTLTTLNSSTHGSQSDPQ